MQAATLTPPPAAGRPPLPPTDRPDPAAVKVPPVTAAPKLLVSMATYNELGNLEPLVREVYRYAPDAHILVVDDNSPDGTGRLADELAAADPRIHVLHRPGKLGLGTAILAAMRYAIDHGYDYLLNMDADFSHPPRFIPGLVAGMSKNDVMVGSRYVKGGGTENWPVSRLIICRAVYTLVRFLFRMRVKEASGAFGC
jgi:dolichol-phosphate mannosyltransferase